MKKGEKSPAPVFVIKNFPAAILGNLEIGTDM